MRATGGEREVPSGRGGLGLRGRRTGSASQSQTLEGNAKRCAAEALGDLGVPASFFCHTDEKKKSKRGLGAAL